MVGNNHLGSKEELIKFAKAMEAELFKHKDEKKSMRRWKLYKSLEENNTPQILTRIRGIESLSYEYFHEFCGGTRRKEILEEIKKQSVHIANYSMMTFLKIEQELEKTGMKPAKENKKK